MAKIMGITVPDNVARDFNQGDINTRSNILRFIGRADLVDKAVSAWVKESFGYLGAIMDIPEIKKVLTRAAKEGWSEARIQGAITKTKYWKTHDASQRGWTQLKGTDPKEAKKRVAAAQENIAAMALREGVNLSAGRSKAIAEQIASGGITDENVIRRLIVAEAQYNPGAGASGLTQQASEIKARANDYGITLTGQGAFDWAKRVESGTADAGIVDEYLRQQAKARFGNNQMVLSALDRGQTVRQALDPQIAQVSDLLEIDPDTINLTDTRWSPIIEQPDGGDMRIMTSAEAARFARGMPQYKSTKNAQDQAASLAEKITQQFGATA